MSYPRRPFNPSRAEVEAGVVLICIVAAIVIALIPW
jgi:hypothetical protein